MERQHVISLFAALALTGCAAPSTPAVLKAAPVVAPAKAPLKVVKQHAALTLEQEGGSGAITMEFVFRKPQGYALQATVADVGKITVALKTRSFLLMRTVATAEVTRAQMLNGRAAVNFTGLKAGSYSLDIAALDDAGTELGTTTASATVVDGETTTVDAKINLNPAAQAASAPTGSGLGLDLQILDG